MVESSGSPQLTPAASAFRRRTCRCDGHRCGDQQRCGFRKDRGLAAWLGIVPRQYSTGGKAKLFGISKLGNRYLRKILIRGNPSSRAADQNVKVCPSEPDWIDWMPEYTRTNVTKSSTTPRAPAPM